MRQRLLATRPDSARPLPLRPRRWVAALAAAALLAACGGGGEDDPSAVVSAGETERSTEEMQATATFEAEAQWQALENSVGEILASETANGADPSAGTERERALAISSTPRRSATWYQATGGGNCQYANVSRIGGRLLVAALNDWDITPLGGAPNQGQMCGAYINVTGAVGTVRVLVTDRCPYKGNPKCVQGHIDLSEDAFRAVSGDTRIGWLRSWDANQRNRVTWSYAVGTNARVSYRSMPGTNAYWIGIQVLNHNRALRSLEIDPAGNNRWVALRRNANVFALQCSSHFTGTQGRCPTYVRVRLTPMSGTARTEWVALPRRAATVVGTIRI